MILFARSFISNQSWATSRASDGTWQFRLQADPRIAHVRITLFGDRTAEELTEVLDQLVGEGVQAVVLDLRDNAGGVLDAAVAVCDMFLPANLDDRRDARKKRRGAKTL